MPTELEQLQQKVKVAKRREIVGAIVAVATAIFYLLTK
jgi:hypothetical protein